MVMIQRRRLLQGAGLWAVASPLMFRSQRARAMTDGPRRVIVLFSPNGPTFETGPTDAGSTENSPILKDWWSPLERHLEKGNYFRWCHQPGVLFGDLQEYGHLSGSCAALTATPSPDGVALGPSLDQFIGQGLQARGVITPQRSLHWGLFDSVGHYHAFYEGAGQKIAPVDDPFAALQTIMPSFGDVGPSQQQLRKHFVLDNLVDDCRRLRSQVNSEGRQVLDFHCNNIESLELSVGAALEASSRSCLAPTSGLLTTLQEGEEYGNDEKDAQFDAFRHLMALSFVCDVTRVIGFGFGNGASRYRIPSSYGIPTSGTVDSGDSGPQMHAWTHQPESDESRGAIRTFYQWFSERVALLLDTLETTLDADGVPLMDSTLVLWTSEFGTGNHHNDRIPVLLFGDGCGEFATGRHFEPDHDLPREERALHLHRLFTSIARHAGLDDVDSFGFMGDYENQGRGPLEWLRG